MPRSTMFDDVANDLAIWIDETASKVALALAPAQSPFAAPLTEQQKLEVYKRLLFNADGSPNAAGRAKELARLGPEGFAHVYKAVVHAFPDLAPVEPENPDSIEALAPMPQGPPPGGPPGPPPMMPGPPPGPPGLPPGMPPGPPPPGPPGMSLPPMLPPGGP